MDERVSDPDGLPGLSSGEDPRIKSGNDQEAVLIDPNPHPLKRLEISARRGADNIKPVENG